jgi:hypothetical protein
LNFGATRAKQEQKNIFPPKTTPEPFPLLEHNEGFTDRWG